MKPIFQAVLKKTEQKNLNGVLGERKITQDSEQARAKRVLLAGRAFSHPLVPSETRPHG